MFAPLRQTPRHPQAAGEHLASFRHQLDAEAAATALHAFAALGARNPPFYDLLLRRLLTTPRPDRVTPQTAGALYRWVGGPLSCGGGAGAWGSLGRANEEAAQRGTGLRVGVSWPCGRRCR